VVQTGFYSLKLDCDTMQLSGYDALPGSDYLTALNEDVTVFSPAKLSLRFEKDGVAYTCTSGMVQDRDDQYVRLIESGQFVQRFDHVGLVFTSEKGDVLEKPGRLEITAWPEHVVLSLDLSGLEGITKTGIQLISPAGKIHRTVGEGRHAALVLQPHLDAPLKPLDSSVCVGSSQKTGKALAVRFNEEEHGLQLDLPMDAVRFPADTNRLDEFVIEIRNPSKDAASLPLIFNEIRPQAITGTSMVLCEEDGRPTGIPVQVSKNWHNDKDHRVKHDGPWLRGYTMVPLKAGETRRFRLRVVTGYWGGVPAVSYSQLCVIGYGGNWKWDESALGCWGESMCYDPSQHLGASFITDVRPSFTPGKNGKPYEWTENVGGGDFLVYFDSDDTYRWAKRLKTAYRWTGPNMAEVLYSGMTDDDRIRFNYRIRSVRTADYHRRFHSFKYEFLKDVVSPKRLVFHQMAADYYNSVQFNQFYVGDQSGLKEIHSPIPGLAGYGDTPIPFNDAWLSVDDATCNDGESSVANGRRGLLNLQSTLNGNPFPVFIHPFGLGRSGARMNFDLSAESVSRSYSAGDVVEGELEFVMPAKSTEVYWGTDREFAGRLEAYGTNAWQAVADEYGNNVQLLVSVHDGELLRNYPIEIQTLSNGNVLADFTIERGGIGHVPIILRGVPLGCSLNAECQRDGKWIPVDHYYQGIRDANGLQDCVFNLARPSTGSNGGWHVRIISVED
jgi:hypothetical protein